MKPTQQATSKLCGRTTLPQRGFQFSCYDLYVAGSNSFRPDRLFKVTEIKQLCYFSTQSPFISTHFSAYTLTSPQMALYIFLTAFSIWRGFCMSGRKLLDPTAYTLDYLSCRQRASPLSPDYSSPLLNRKYRVIKKRKIIRKDIVREALKNSGFRLFLGLTHHIWRTVLDICAR